MQNSDEALEEEFIADIALRHQQGLEFIDPVVIDDNVLAQGV